jgi:hypothetical protein
MKKYSSVIQNAIDRMVEALEESARFSNMPVETRDKMVASEIDFLTDEFCDDDLKYEAEEDGEDFDDLY